MDVLACPAASVTTTTPAAGTVRFRAVYNKEGQRGILAETSRFIRHDGRWSYLCPVD